MKGIIITYSIFLLASCSISADKNTKTENSINCIKIDSLISERYKWRSGNSFSNKIIPVLEKASGIESNCNKGTFGYLYFNDSLFNADIEKWRKYFNCK
jgi:hypothetical protein